MKKLFAVLLSLALLCAIIPAGTVFVSAADTSGKTGDCTWSLSGTELTISGNGKMGDYYLDLDTSSPWGNSITKVTIENGVTSIGDYAFYGCYVLTSVTIPNSVTSIGDGAFYSCSSLTSVTIPNSITSIGTYAFCDCSGLTAVTIPNGVKSIAYQAFFGCSGLTSVIVGSGVESIGDWAFYNCYKLVEVINNSSLTIVKGLTNSGYIAYYAAEVSKGTQSKIVNDNGYFFYTFSGTNYLLGYYGNDTDLVLPENYNGESYEIWQYAFYDNDKITSVTIPDSVNGIGSFAFSCCTGLKSFTIPNSVKDIGIYVFSDCTGLTSVTVGSGVKSIDEGTFYGCSGLKRFTMGNSVENIGISAFENCTRLITVTIGNGVTSIGDYAFENCRKLAEVINYSSLNIEKGSYDYGSVAYYALEVHKESQSKTVNKNDFLFYTFGGTNYLLGYYGNDINLVLPENYNGESYQIWQYAFYKKDKLTSITIPGSVTGIGDDAFYGCMGLKGVYITDLAAWCKILLNNYNSNPLYYAHNLYLNGTLVTDLVIPSGVTSISDYVFWGYNELVSVTIPDSVTSIGYDAFGYCSKLAEIINYSSLNIEKGSYGYGSVAYYALEVHDDSKSRIVNKNNFLFYTVGGTNYLLGYYGNDTDLVFPENYNGESYEIWQYAFYGNDKLNSVIIPNCVTIISSAAFDGCTGLKTVYYCGSEDEWESIDIGSYNEDLLSAEIYYNFDPFDGTFPDVKKGQWFYDCVQYCAQRGIITGYADGKFGPADNIARQDFVVILARYCKADLSAYQGAGSLKDVKAGQYYTAAVNWANDNKIVTGYDDGRFGVGDPMTREQLVTMFYRFAKNYLEINVDYDNTKASGYSDYNKVSVFAKDAIGWAIDKGVMGGMDATHIGPQGNASRAQVAKIIMNVDQNHILDKTPV